MPFCMNCGHNLESSLSCGSCGWDVGKLVELARENSAALSFSNVRHSDAAKLVEILGVVSLADSITRLEEARAYAEFIKAKSFEVWERTLSFEFFDYAVQAYLFGFDHAAVYFADLAVELALATSQGHFSPVLTLIREASDKLGTKLAEKATDLHLLRNCYVHYQTLYQYSQLQDAEISEAIRSSKDIDKAMREEFLRLSEIFSESIRRRFPLPVESNVKLRKYTDFLRRRSEEYMEWFRGRGLTPLDLVRDIREHGASRWYDRRGYDALDAIKKSHEILSQLGTFEKVQVQNLP